MIFTPEDFSFVGAEKPYSDHAARIANEKIEKLLGQEVFLQNIFTYDGPGPIWMERNDGAYKKARLFDVKDL